MMTKAEALYELAKQLPDETVEQMIEFAQGRQTLPYTRPRRPIPAGTLTGLKGIAKSVDSSLSDQDLRDEYSDY